MNDIFKTSQTLKPVAGKLFKTGCYLLLLWLMVGNLIPISYGIADSRVIFTYSTDEGHGVERTLRNLKDGNLDPNGFYHYGYVYQTIGYYTIRGLEQLNFKVDATLVALVFRLISFFSYLLCGFLVYKLYQYYISRDSWPYAMLTALFLMSLPCVFYWGRYLHPDTLQMALILVAVLIAVSRQTVTGFWLAAAVAGVAFGTKYSGLFILPFLFLPVGIQTLFPLPRTKKEWLRLIAIGLVGILIFLVVWALVNPYSIKNFSHFKKDFLFEKNHVAYGHGRAADTNPLLWFQQIWNLCGPLNSILLGLGFLSFLIFFVKDAIKETITKQMKRPQQRSLLTMLLYVSAYFLYLMMAVRMRTPRYLFPVLPFIVLLSVYGFQQIGSRWRRKYTWLPPLIIGILFLSTATMVLRSVTDAGKETYKNANPRIEAGNYLAQHTDGNLKVLANPYCYVPPKFQKVSYKLFIDEKCVRLFKPDIIYLSTSGTKRWSWKKRGTSFKDLNLIKGPNDDAAQLLQFHKKLFAPQSKWEIIYETYDVVILKKKK